jgi:hypothetical protein
VTTLVPNRKVVERVLDNRLNFVEDQNEWVGEPVRVAIRRPNALPRSV